MSPHVELEWDKIMRTLGLRHIVEKKNGCSWKVEGEVTSSSPTLLRPGP